MEKLKQYQRIIFSTMFIGYACYAYNRKTVSFAMPKLMEEGLTKNEAGLIISSQNMAYAISKFLGGVLSDRISSRLLFSSGLIVSGLATLAFSGSHSVLAYTALWFLNGFAQGCGWPSCAKVLKQWYAPSQFGTWWSVLSASANISGGVSPFISAFLILNYGWRFSLFIAGIVSIFLGFISFFSIINSPSYVGLKSFSDDSSKRNDQKSTKEKTTFLDLIKSPFLLLVSFCYMIVFCAKTSTVDWGQLYLMEDRGHSQYVGSSFTSSVESGGFFGGVLAGYLTDWVLQQNLKKGTSYGRGNPRMPVAVIFMAGVLGCLHILQFVITESTSQFWITTMGFILGACLYGPIAIFGVVAAESAPTHLSGSAHAIVALAANVGAITSGLPFSYIASYWNWGAIFFLLELITGATILAMLFNRNLSSDIGKKRKD